MEPDNDNFNLLQTQMERIGLDEKQICIKKGLWEKETVLFFEGGNETGSKIVEYQTDEHVETTTIDNISSTYNAKIDFIKMDIEGSELPALRGGISK